MGFQEHDVAPLVVVDVACLAAGLPFCCSRGRIAPLGAFRGQAAHRPLAGRDCRQRNSPSTYSVCVPVLKLPSNACAFAFPSSTSTTQSLRLCRTRYSATWCCFIVVTAGTVATISLRLGSTNTASTGAGTISTDALLPRVHCPPSMCPSLFICSPRAKRWPQLSPALSKPRIEPASLRTLYSRGEGGARVTNVPQQKVNAAATPTQAAGKGMEQRRSRRAAAVDRCDRLAIRRLDCACHATRGCTSFCPHSFPAEEARG